VGQIRCAHLGHYSLAQPQDGKFYHAVLVLGPILIDTQKGKIERILPIILDR
jgi:hypothetical protein